LNVVLVKVAGTVTDPGTFRVLLVFPNVTRAPLAGALLDRVTVQVVEEFGPTAVGLQDMEETRTAADRLMVTLADALFKVAVRVAD